ncbi:MAG: Threonine--tRNA ligase [Phycisphaerae bacterium]|nr:Threonine--tRNA ligase [Phycisphaerae bacterium]
MPNVTLPDGAVHALPDGATAFDLAQKIGPGLAKAALAALVSTDGGQNWEIRDLHRPLLDDCSARLLTEKDDLPQTLYVLRHSTAHVMAEAICRLYPQTKLVYGPPVDDGFYYDIDLEEPITPEAFPRIEAEMQKIISEDRPFTRCDFNREEGLTKVRSENNRYKVDNAVRAEGDLSFYVTGTPGKNFEDLCRGPHIPSTGRIKAFKVLQVSGAYYRGDQNEKQLQRVYGTAFPSRKLLEEHLHRLEEAKKRDHRRIGPQLGLFHLQEEAPGAVFWHPRGWAMYQIVQGYIREMLGHNGYYEVNTPQLMDRSLWEKSGHWEKFRDNMFSTETEAHTFAIKPMNCPGHIQIFKQGLRSYRELPLRLSEFGSCHRNEQSGVLHGLMRVRAFVQDDGHIFCTDEQVPEEVARFCDLVKLTYGDFGFTDMHIRLATRPPLRTGDDATWDRAEAALARSLSELGLHYELAPGEGAFYGPKIEFNVRDCLGRPWQLGTIQIDYVMPGRLGARFVGEDNTPHVPVMLHRAICGSLERFLGILIEHHAGSFPLWLAPIQVAVTTVSEKSVSYGHEVVNWLRQHGMRAVADFSSDRIGPKKQRARDQKIPYILVIGEQEAVDKSVNVNNRDGVTLGTFPFERFVEGCVHEITTRGREQPEGTS